MLHENGAWQEKRSGMALGAETEMAGAEKLLHS